MLGDLEPGAHTAAIALLHTVLSERGMQKAMAIVALEDVLREIETAVAFAEASPAPGRADLLTDVI